MEINALRIINNQLLELIYKKEKLEQALSRRTAGIRYFNNNGPVIVSGINLADYIAAQEAALTVKIENRISALTSQISNYIITTVSFGEAPVEVDDTNVNVAKEIRNLFTLYDERVTAIERLNNGDSYLADQGSFPELSEANLDLSDVFAQNRSDLLTILTDDKNQLYAVLTSYNISLV